MNRRGLLAGLASIPFVGLGATVTLQTMLDAGVFANFPGTHFGKRTIYDIADEIMEALLPQHPEGFGPRKEYHVDVDEPTGNIIIHNDILGFAITRRTIEDNVHIKTAKISFGWLMKAIEQARQGEI